MIPDQKQINQMLSQVDPDRDVRSDRVATELVRSALKADSKLPSSLQIVLAISLLNGVLEGYKLPFRITLVTTPAQQ